MSIKNLHSLLDSKWFIHESYGRALLPSLFSILERGVLANSENTPESFFSFGAENSEKLSSLNQKENSEDYVLIVSLKNPIYKYNQECGPKGTKSKMRLMKAYESDPNCKGVVLDVDSGGGQVSGTPEFHDFVSNYSKPVVAYTDGLMCSAAYYIACASSYIIANKRVDAIGSIGTMVYFLDTTGIYEKKGAKVIEAYATKSTNKNKDFRSLLSGDTESYIKNVLDPITEDFHTDVKNSRKNIDEDVFTGGTYNANQSLENGLVDEIGTLSSAIDKVFELSKSNTSNSNNSNTKMSKKINVPAVQNVLGYTEPFGANENGVFLQEIELEKLNTVLKETTQNAVDLQSDLDTAETAINTALDNAGIEYNDTTSLDAKINLLNDQRNEYANKPAANPSNVASKGDTNFDEGAEEVVYAHVEEAKKLLKL